LEKELVERGITPKFYLVGNKVIQAFKRYSEAEVLGRMGNMTATPSVQDSNVIAETLTNAFLSGEIDGIEILSTRFNSMISYKINMTPVIPVKGIIEEFQPSIDVAQSQVKDVPERDEHAKIKGELILEPDPVSTLDKLVPMYMGNIIYLQLLEASASELAARMTAMSNATSNASDMITKLTILYNKARQASITQEILEVVSGAQALS
jgi:F-type H+-transporting ATPase subunit gamma